MTFFQSLRKTLVIGGSVIAMSAALTLSGKAVADDDPIVWKVQSHWPGASTSYEDSLKRIKRVIEERTDGRLKLELYEAGQLFKAQEIFNAVSRGIIEMGTISPAYAQDKMTLAGIASGLPFAFHNVWEAVYFHKNMGFEQQLREEAAKFNVYYATDKIYPTEMVVKQPIKSWDDFTGLKIRSSGATQVFLTEAGAAATYIPGSELYQALSSGIVDGAHWGAAQGAASMALYEIAKYHVKPALNIAGTDAFIINLDAMEELPDDIARIVKDALEEQFWVRTNEYLYQERIALAKAMKEQGVQVNVLPEDVQTRLAEVAQKMWAEEAKRSPEAAATVEKLRNYLSSLGYL